MTSDVIPAATIPRIPVSGGGTFPVRRIHCVGRNFADHAREMGAAVPDPESRGRPVLFMKPADSVVVDGRVPYPPATAELHHEVELVVALGRDADGLVDPQQAAGLVFGYGVGVDLTRRDLQAAAKAKGLPWDAAKGFDCSAPVSTLVPSALAGNPAAMELSLHVNGQRRQHASLDQMIWNVGEILHELSRLYALRAGDLVFMGTPAGVSALQPGDICQARLGKIAELEFHIIPAAV